jgi:hypothetical protein
MKLEKRLAMDNSNESAARVASNASTASTPAPAPVPPSDGGLTTIQVHAHLVLKRTRMNWEMYLIIKESMKVRSMQVAINLARTFLFTRLSHTHVPPRPQRLLASPPPLASPFLLQFMCTWRSILEALLLSLSLNM